MTRDELLVKLAREALHGPLGSIERERCESLLAEAEARIAAGDQDAELADNSPRWGSARVEKWGAIETAVLDAERLFAYAAKVGAEWVTLSPADQGHLEVLTVQVRRSLAAARDAHRAMVSEVARARRVASS